MKNKTALQVAFWGNAVLAVLIMLLTGVMGGVMFVVVAGLLAGMLYKGKDYKVAVIVISALMAILNLAMESAPDVLAWIMTIVLVLL